MRATAAVLRGERIGLPMHLNGRLVGAFGSLPVLSDDLLDKQQAEQEVSISDQPVLVQNNSRKLWESARTHLGLTNLVDTSLDISDDQIVQRGSSRERVTQVDKRLEEVDQGRVRVGGL
jgi:hypothetical protein